MKVGLSSEWMPESRIARLISASCSVSWRFLPVLPWKKRNVMLTQ